LPAPPEPPGESSIQHAQVLQPRGLESRPAAFIGRPTMAKLSLMSTIFNADTAHRTTRIWDITGVATSLILVPGRLSLW
jgi:hypothetical protein